MKQLLRKIARLFKTPVNNQLTLTEPETGWLSDEVTCDICTHSWVAVYHEDSERLECPNCEHMVQFEEGGLNV